MLRILVVSLLMSAALLIADESDATKLAAPTGWGGETIQLPPGFAADMTLKGSEHIRFAPGMMNPDSDSFFCYAFVFELQSEPVLTQAVIKEEFLKYYRGLCKAVLSRDPTDVDLSKFTLDLQRIRSESKDASDSEQTRETSRYTGVLDWVEPFATKTPQKLNLEIRTWAKDDHNYIFVCASPQSVDSAIWKQLRAIRDDYLSK